MLDIDEAISYLRQDLENLNTAISRLEAIVSDRRRDGQDLLAQAYAAIGENGLAPDGMQQPSAQRSR